MIVTEKGPFQIIIIKYKCGICCFEVTSRFQHTPKFYPSCAGHGGLIDTVNTETREKPADWQCNKCLEINSFHHTYCLHCGELAFCDRHV